MFDEHVTNLVPRLWILKFHHRLQFRCIKFGRSRAYHKKMKQMKTYTDADHEACKSAARLACNAAWDEYACVNRLEVISFCVNSSSMYY